MEIVAKCPGAIPPPGLRLLDAWRLEFERRIARVWCEEEEGEGER